MTGRDVVNVGLLVLFLAALAYLLWVVGGAGVGRVAVICVVALVAGMLWRILRKAAR